MAREMMDELDSMAERAERTRAEVARKAAPLLKKREALVAKIQPLENELREINAKIKEIEAPARDAGRVLAVVARAKSHSAVNQARAEDVAAASRLRKDRRKR